MILLGQRGREMGKALRCGERVEMAITDVAFGGDGVGRVSDLVLFVPFTVDGDEAEVEITEVRKRYARGRLVRILSPSPHRVVPACPDHGRCGGCRMQHIAHGHQMELLQRQIGEIFRRIGGMYQPSLLPVIPSPLALGWRGKAEFHLAGREGGRRIGLMAPASNELVEVERCGIVAESINGKFGRLRARLRSGEAAVPGDRQVIWSDEPGEPPTEVFMGEGRAPDVVRVVCGRRLTVPGRGFFQANVSLVGELVAQVAGICPLSGGETLIDAYGGAGLFSVFLGPAAGRIYGIEGDREAVRCAGINLERAGLRDARFFHGDAGEVLCREFTARRRGADAVLLDPPRDGCGSGVLEALAEMRPRRIVYISCNPATQARDVRFLAGRGYSLERLQPFDMFPQTGHVEVVALLTAGG